MRHRVPALDLAGFFAGNPGKNAAGSAAQELVPPRQQDGEHAKRRQSRADQIDEADAVLVGQNAKRRRGDAAHAEAEAEEDAGHHADPAGQQLLCKDHDRREGRGQDQPDQHRQHARGDKPHMRQRQGEGQHAEDRDPDHRHRPPAVGDRPAQHRARGDGAEEQEQHQLRGAGVHLEGVDEVEGVIRAHRGHVDVLGEGQEGQHDERQHHPVARQRQGLVHRLARPRLQMRAIPAADPGQDGAGDHRKHAEEGDRAAPEGQHDEGREQRADRGAEIAAHLEHRLREPEAPARSEPRHPARLGVEDRRAEADQHRADDQQRPARRKGEHHHAEEGRDRGERQRPGLRPGIGEDADHRLQERGRALEGQRHQPDLPVIQREIRLQHRIDRREHRLHHIVHHVTQRNRDQDRKDGRARAGAGWLRHGGHRAVPRVCPMI
ncbi:hypothetical protein SDC9_21364 [bioreactor metagenome]|uniref:Uncharacterized protein n=1 Tax=bioreactor metagenome TaxID=1076179 RepID=A0A644U9C8_9ZZZZ